MLQASLTHGLTALLLAGCVLPPHHPPPAPAPHNSPAARPPRKPAAPPPGRSSAIDLTTFVRLREEGKLLVYDVRPSWYFHLGHIPGATSLPGRSFEEAFPAQKPVMDAALAARRTIVVYCTDLKCPDGRAVARMLSAKGYPVSVLTGGWEQWKEADMPTE